MCISLTSYEKDMHLYLFLYFMMHNTFRWFPIDVIRKQLRHEYFFCHRHHKSFSDEVGQSYKKYTGCTLQTSVKGGDGGNSSLGRGSKANASSEALKCKHRKHVTLITAGSLFECYHTGFVLVGRSSVTKLSSFSIKRRPLNICWSAAFLNTNGALWRLM